MLLALGAEVIDDSGATGPNTIGPDRQSDVHT